MSTAYVLYNNMAGDTNTLESVKLLEINSNDKMKYIDDFSRYPERPVVRKFLSNEKGNPCFCSEKLDFTQVSEDVAGTSFDVAVCDFYKMLYNAVIKGEPLEITPEKAAKVISVIEACHAQNPLPVKFL